MDRPYGDVYESECVGGRLVHRTAGLIGAGTYYEDVDVTTEKDLKGSQ